MSTPLARPTPPLGPYPAHAPPGGIQVSIARGHVGAKEGPSRRDAGPCQMSRVVDEWGADAWGRAAVVVPVLLLLVSAVEEGGRGAFRSVREGKGRGLACSSSLLSFPAFVVAIHPWLAGPDSSLFFFPSLSYSSCALRLSKARPIWCFKGSERASKRETEREREKRLRSPLWFPPPGRRSEGEHVAVVEKSKFWFLGQARFTSSGLRG